MGGRLANQLQVPQRQRQTRKLYDLVFRSLLDMLSSGEWVALDYETTGLNVHTDEIASIGAVRIAGNHVLISEPLELLIRSQGEMCPEGICVHRPRNRDLDSGVSIEQAIHALPHFVGSRPLADYYLEFDVAMLNQVVVPMLGIGLPQLKIEVPVLYYDYQLEQLSPCQQQGDPDLDPRLVTAVKELDSLTRDVRDVLNDTVMAVLAFVRPRQLGVA